MMQLVYDGSFDGFLTAIFEIYDRKLNCNHNVNIEREKNHQPALYGAPFQVITDSTKAQRVWKGLQRKISTGKLTEFYKTFLSEKPEVENVLTQFVRYVFSSEEDIEKDFSNKYVLAIAQIARQVHREKHRMEAFIRFQQTKDDIYYATIEPDFNVLPLIAKHFKDRYADQHWIIYDKKRSYGISYNKTIDQVTEVLLNLSTEANHEFLPVSLVKEEEPMYQSLWKEYFTSVNISPRKNDKLHIRHVPRRYWKYLTEKK